MTRSVTAESTLRRLSRLIDDPATVGRMAARKAELDQFSLNNSAHSPDEGEMHGFVDPANLGRMRVIGRMGLKHAVPHTEVPAVVEVTTL